ncbi:conserved hypothetical protein [Pseudomonas sp. 8AS]|nr:conserved hypothetical protein [Pseudomonas sp. 8AS]
MVDVGDDGDIAEIFDHSVVSIKDSAAATDGGNKIRQGFNATAGREGGGGYCHRANPAVYAGR